MSLMRCEQVGAGRVDVAGELDLLGREVAGGVVGELLAEDEDGIERRAQLVGHVGQELGLVFRGERQLGGLFLERAAGLLDLGVLALDLGVLLGEQPRLGAQLLVGLLQLALAGLQLDGELLRLREQALGAHRRLDGVEHDADALRELLEEGQVRGGEGLERGQLDDRLGLPFEEHGQHDDARPGGPRRDWSEMRDVVRRHVGEQDALLLHRALADEALAQADRLRELAAAAVRVADEQLQLGLVVGCRPAGRSCPAGP